MKWKKTNPGHASFRTRNLRLLFIYFIYDGTEVLVSITSPTTRPKTVHNPCNTSFKYADCVLSRWSGPSKQEATDKKNPEDCNLFGEATDVWSSMARVGLYVYVYVCVWRAAVPISQCRKKKEQKKNILFFCCFFFNMLRILWVAACCSNNQFRE